MIKSSLILLIFLCLHTSVLARGEEFEALRKILHTQEKSVLSDFNKYHQDFTKTLCKPGTEEKFWTLFREFQGSGYYLPKTVKDELDRKTLNRFYPELLKKQEWIQNQRKSLLKIDNFNELKKELKSLEEDVEQLVKYKETFEESEDDTIRISVKNKSKYLFLSFKKKFLDFLKKVPFLTSYRYPVDHFELRENYDEVKGSDDPLEKQRANEVYFYRKIVQDGAQNPNRSHSDRFLRAMLDTLTLRMKDNPEFIPEEVRYDLASAFYGLEKQLKRGPKRQAMRFEEWEERTKNMIEFYKSMKNNRVKVGEKFETGDQLIKLQNKARAELKDFVLSRHKLVYQYWASKPAIHQALYVLITTLFNEVGGIDGPHALDRRDVIQVVLNRVKNKKYNFIPPTDWLFDYLVSENKKTSIKDHPWLNVMFKEGEFSFTYYFIHGAVRVFCPDQTRIGKRLRKTNLKLAVEGLKKKEKQFNGVRYFSRASMLGRISMEKIWSDYRSVPERVGVPLKKKKSFVLKRYKAGDYNYRYHFNDINGVRMKVIEVDDDVYVLNTKTKEVFSYRNPHYFRYFEPTP
ncbi:MAG: hypothetical protein VXV96_04815 [Bdellovibrionota bacterium]|nr:hypothetical protein [Bdellovibrionota bacterium]